MSPPSKCEHGQQQGQGEGRGQGCKIAMWEVPYSRHCGSSLVKAESTAVRFRGGQACPQCTSELKH
eukprot:361377-Chlamydomonas_euryale.AAC.7